MSWLEGQSLAQTVFTCLYLHDTDLIEDRCLRAYCLGVLKVCDILKDKIYKVRFRCRSRALKRIFGGIFCTDHVQRLRFRVLLFHCFLPEDKNEFECSQLFD